MNAQDRTRLAIKALGWQGGTVHDLCKEIGLDVDEFLHGHPKGICDPGSDFTLGWFAVRTCKTFPELAKKAHGNLQFWFGVCSGLMCKEVDEQNN